MHTIDTTMNYNNNNNKTRQLRQINIAATCQCLSILFLFLGGGYLLMLLHYSQQHTNSSSNNNDEEGHKHNSTTSYNHYDNNHYHNTSTSGAATSTSTTTVPTTTATILTTLHYLNNNNYNSSCGTSNTATDQELLSIVLLLQRLFQQLLGGVLISYAIGTGLLLFPLLYDIRTTARNTRTTTATGSTNPNPSRITTAITTNMWTDSIRTMASSCHYASTISTLIFALCVIIATILVDSKLTAHNNNSNDDNNDNDDDSGTNHTILQNYTSTFIRYNDDDDLDHDYIIHATNDHYRQDNLSHICNVLLIMGMSILLLSSMSLMITFWPTTQTVTTTTATQTRSLRSYTDHTGATLRSHFATSRQLTREDDNDGVLLDPLITPLMMECVEEQSERRSNNNNHYTNDTDIHSNIENGIGTMPTTIGDTAMDVSQQPPSNPTTTLITTTSTNQISATRRLLQLASSQIVYLYLGCIVLLLRLPFSLAIPHFVSTTLNAVAVSNFTSAHEEIQWLFIAGTIDAILDFWAFFLFGYANQRIVRKLRIDLFTRLLCQEVAFFDIHSSGELSSRLNSDCGEMAGDLTWFFRFSIESVVRITGITVYMMVRCPILGTCAISIIPAVAIINKSYGDWLQHNSKKVQDALADANIVAQEALSNIRTVIAFVTEYQECERYEDRIERQYQLNIQQLFMTALYYMVVSTFLINTMVQGTLLWVGSILIERDELAPGVLLAFMLYQSQLQNEVLSLMNSYTSLVKSSGAGDKVFALIDRQPPQPSTASRYTGPHPNVVVEPTPAESNDSSIETQHRLNVDSDIHHTDHLLRQANTTDHFSFENVTFAYPSRQENIILDGLNLTIPRGQTVALVGTSGGGKTTIINLLQRFYDPCSGQLLINGHDLRNVDVMAHRKEIGIVTQDPILFQGTIRDNITYGCLVPDQVREEHVVDAAQLAHAHSFIQSFPDGYDTMIGERGVQLSGGQKQRIGT